MKRLALLSFLLSALLAPAARSAPATPGSFSNAAQTRAVDNARDSVRAVTRSLESDYRINIVTDDVPRASWDVSGEAATDNELGALAAFSTILDEEVRKYSPAFVHSTHLSAIVLVKNLAIGEQRRNAVPDYLRQVLWLDFQSYSRRALYQRHIIHHEFYHMIEFELHGSAYYKDPQWIAFNAPDFHYGDGGVTAYTSKEKKPWSTLSHPQTGFIDLYSMLGVEEDKAEIFAALWMKEEREQMEEWAQTDPVLRAKIDYMKAGIRQIDPAIDEVYWRKLDGDEPLAVPAKLED